MQETNNIAVYETYFYNAEDESEHEHRYYKSEKNAEKQYLKLCRKYWLKNHWFCYTDKNGYTIGYGKIYFND